MMSKRCPDVTCLRLTVVERQQRRPIGHIEPRGTGTGQIEALSGLVCRIAEKQWLSVGAFLDEVSRYHSNHTGITVPKHGHMGCHNVNGLGVYARRLVDALEDASESHGLDRGTFLPWGNIIDERGHGLLKSHLNWCESCWNENVELGEAPYVRLLWALQPVDMCTHHMRKLSSFCPECGAPQRMVPTLPRVWLCQKCGHELFTSRRLVKLTKNANGQKLWVINSLERLIERTCAIGNTLSAGTLAAALRSIIDSYSGGSACRFAKSINMAPRQVIDWAMGASKPFMSTFMELCYRLDIPPDSFLMDGVPLTDVSLWKRPSKPRFVTMNKLTHAEIARITKEMKMLVEESPEPPPLISEVAERMGVTFTVLRYHFPDEYRIIKRRADAWREHCRSIEGKKRIEALIKGVDELVSQGVFPSERHLKQFKYVRPSDLRRPEILELLRELQSSALVVRQRSPE